MKYIFLVLIFQISLFSETLFKFKSEGMDLSLEKVLSVNGVIWAMDFISKDKLIFNMKNGNIGIYNLNTKDIEYIKHTPYVVNSGQGGLLDVAVSPKFKKDKTIYFTYVKEYGRKIVTTLSKAKFVYNDLENWEDLLITKSDTGTSRHFGSRITFDEKGHIFFSVGERGIRENAQNLNNHAGSIIRLNLDGSVPSDNPFFYQIDSQKEIYSYGHRNPQGLFYDKKRKILFSCEHGPRGGDEINIIYKGGNYGWPRISYGREYWSPFYVGESREKEGMIQPIYTYTPSIAPSSLLVYNGNKFPKWKGNLFIGALKLTHLNRIAFNSKNMIIKEERLFDNMDERIRDVIQSPDGLIYISTDSGNIYKIVAN